MAQDTSAQFSLLSLPVEILLEITFYLAPENISSLAQVNKKFSRLFVSPRIWKEKYNEHFPHRKIKKIKEKDIDWRAEFLKAYNEEYGINEATKEDKASLKRNAAKFSYAKEGDVDYFKKLNADKLTFDELMEIAAIKDINGWSVLDWACKNKRSDLLNYFYGIIEEHYQNNDNAVTDVNKTDEAGNSILHWAAYCGQPVETIKSLLEQGANVMLTRLITMAIPHFTSPHKMVISL